MESEMQQELWWLTATTLMTALFWMPYIVNRMVVRGVIETMQNPKPDMPKHADWAERSIAAHKNAIENLAIFAPLVLISVWVGATNSITTTACVTYFFARLVHFVVYTAGVPVVRTLAFVIGFAAQVIIALVILGLL